MPLRPAVALSRLSVDVEGRVLLALRHAWRDGTAVLRSEPEAFVARLAALVPPRGQHTVRYHGVLAPASPLRRRVVLRPGPLREHRRAWIPWATLVQRTFTVDPQRCPRCDARMKQRALVLAGAGDALAWLDQRVDQVRIGPPAQPGPEEVWV